MRRERLQPSAIAFATHPGARARQEDALLAGDRCVLPSSQNPLTSHTRLFASAMECKVPYVCALADGLGGQNAGDVASEICIKNLATFCTGYFADPAKSLALQAVVSGIQRAIEATSIELHRLALTEAELRGLGTTLVALVVCEDGCAVLNLGDSRAYRFENGALSLLTRDDTEAQRLLDLKLLSKDDLAVMSHKNRLTQYVGKYEPGLIVRARETFMAKGERIILLCSDGVSKQLSDEEIKAMLSARESLLERVKMLVETAVRKADADNTSAILIRMGQ